MIKQHYEFPFNLQTLHPLIGMETEMPTGTRNIEEEKEKEKKQL